MTTYSEKELVKRLSIAIMAAVAAGGLAATPVSAQQSMPPAEFGAPPSGEVPILFNDRHVYSRPDELKQDRVLSAIVRGDTILVPLRSMFEQMGATVSYDPATKTVDVSKPGSDVKVTVGVAQVTINGETRPLDVPPEMYRGTVVVPIRVISEGMGAYVQWVPEQKAVVVRYIAPPVPTPPPTAPPTPVPTMRPTPVPTMAPTLPPPVSIVTPSPTPAPPERVYEHFIVGDYIAQPQVFNAFSNGTNTSTWGPSYAGRAAFEFPLGKIPVMVEGYAEQYAYTHPGGAGIPPGTPCTAGLAGNPACVTTIGGGSNIFVPQFQAVEGNAGARVGVQVANPRIYVAASYLWATTNYGYPRMHGYGFGIEKLPDLDHSFSVFGSGYYYPLVQGNYTDPNTGTNFNVQYRYLQYQAGLAFSIPTAQFGRAGLFLEAGYMGNSKVNRQFMPSNGRESGGFAGIGIHF
jgi:hypothetical protein